MDKIIASVKFVVEHSEHVKIDLKKIDDFCEYFSKQHTEQRSNQAPFDMKKLGTDEKLHFLLVLNSICFSYRGDPKRRIIYHDKEFDGAYGMIAAIGRAVENNIPILDAAYLSNISEADFGKIVEGNVQIPLFEERLHILREIGTVLLTRFNGKFSNLLEKADHDALPLIDLIIDAFPSFRDESNFKGKTVYFYKRAQVLVADIYQAFAGHDFGALKNIDKITACSDYKLPFVLRRLGILSYSNYLMDKIDNQIQIDKDSEEEIEIRANTVRVVEVIKNKLKTKNPNINSIHINDHIWMLGQQKIENDKPYHHTRTTAY